VVAAGATCGWPVLEVCRPGPTARRMSGMAGPASAQGRDRSRSPLRLSEQAGLVAATAPQGAPVPVKDGCATATIGVMAAQPNQAVATVPQPQAMCQPAAYPQVVCQQPAMQVYQQPAYQQAVYAQPAAQAAQFAPVAYAPVAYQYTAFRPQDPAAYQQAVYSQQLAYQQVYQQPAYQMTYPYAAAGQIQVQVPTTVPATNVLAAPSGAPNPNPVPDPSVPGITDVSFQSKVVMISREKTFGFITCPPELGDKVGNKDIFIHKADVGSFQVNDDVSFYVRLHRDGRPQARDIILVGRAASVVPPPQTAMALPGGVTLPCAAQLPTLNSAPSVSPAGVAPAVAPAIAPAIAPVGAPAIAPALPPAISPQPLQPVNMSGCQTSSGAGADSVSAGVAATPFLSGQVLASLPTGACDGGTAGITEPAGELQSLLGALAKLQEVDGKEAHAGLQHQPNGV